MLKRSLEQTLAVAPEVEMSFPSLIRTASENGLLRSGWDRWAEFRRARNLTSHMYDEDVARQVVEQIPEFAVEAEFLFAALERQSRDA
jgi:nucleotidyltransferase substrate binding protein (TIGR01987 family)